MSATVAGTRRRVRRNRISEADAIAVAVVAGVAGVVAVLAGVAPTAWAPADVVDRKSVV